METGDNVIVTGDCAVKESRLTVSNLGGSNEPGGNEQLNVSQSWNSCDELVWSALKQESRELSRCRGDGVTQWNDGKRVAFGMWQVAGSM